MFTGLIAHKGVVAEMRATPDGGLLAIHMSRGGGISVGDSVAVNGVCLTATAVSADGFDADVSNQTLSRTSLGSLRSGSPVNLELALRPTDRLGGHIVQGHVDDLGRVRELERDGFACRVTVECPPELLRYVVSHGSVAVDGVSLTVAELGEDTFTVSLVPETLTRTTLGALVGGQVVNIEVDVLGRYVERLVTAAAG